MKVVAGKTSKYSNTAKNGSNDRCFVQRADRTPNFEIELSPRHRTSHERAVVLELGRIYGMVME